MIKMPLLFHKLWAYNFNILLQEQMGVTLTLLTIYCHLQIKKPCHSSVALILQSMYFHKLILCSYGKY